MILDTERLRDDGAYRTELRHRCFTDHLFLAEMVGLTSFVPRIHQPCVDLYFPKNPNLSIPEQHPIKYRMHLDPRGTFKTTLGRVDSLQWILAFPETITMLNIGATQPLAKKIGEQTAIYLYQQKGKNPTPLQLLFPDLVYSKKPDGEWSTNNREIGQLDETISYTSPNSSQSGWHPWMLNPDDMVDTDNSGIHANPTVRRAVIDAYDTNKNTRRPGGYVNFRGTRYHPFDAYGIQLDRLDPDEWKILIRGVLTVKSGKRMMPGEFPAEDDVVLNFPELPEMDYRTLRQRFNEAYESFMCQQMNDPQGGHVPLFDEHLYKTMLIPPEKIPVLGDTFICWRLPYQGKDYMKRAEGAAVRVWDGRIYVIDAWAGTYTPSRLAEKIVREAKRHQTGMVMLESLPGTQYMEAEIRNEAIRRNQSLFIQWLEFQEDDTDRKARIEQLEPQTKAGRVLVSTSTGQAAELRKQLLNFGLVPENGIVDCISRLAAKVPVSVLRQEIEDEERERQLERHQSLLWKHVYAQMGGMQELQSRQQQEAAAAAAAWDKVNTYGLTDILGGLEG